MDDSVIAAIRSQRTSAKWRAYPADAVPVWIAEMDFSLAPCVAQALHQAIDASDTGYRWPGDLPEALADFLHRHFAWQIAPEHVFTLPDVLTGMAEAMRRFTRAGQSVVITPPVYPPFFNVTRAIAEREVVEVPLVDDCLDLESLEAAFARPEVAAFLMCHPHNPTGYCAPVEVLRSVAALARKYDVTVISDEIWAPLSWDENPFVPYLSFDPELTAPDVVLVSASKAFNLAVNVPSWLPVVRKLPSTFARPYPWKSHTGQVIWVLSLQLRPTAMAMGGWRKRSSNSRTTLRTWLLS